jgi:mRNA-degrading endonuclease RelE of RelBE toxin-antitoxin system
MDAFWLTAMKTGFTIEWLGLPPKEAHQVLEKIKLLKQDPKPDVKIKKQLKYMNGRLYRINCVDYRIFYTFEHPYSSLLALRHKGDDIYGRGQAIAPTMHAHRLSKAVHSRGKGLSSP